MPDTDDAITFSWPFDYATTYLAKNYDHLLTAVERELLQGFGTFRGDGPERRCEAERSENPEVRVRAGHGVDAFQRELADRLRREHPDKIFFSECVICGHLSRCPTDYLCYRCTPIPVDPAETASHLRTHELVVPGVAADFPPPPVKALVAFHQQRASQDEFLQCLVAYRGWLIPQSEKAEQGALLKGDFILVPGSRRPPDDELWLFTDYTALRRAGVGGACAIGLSVAALFGAPGKKLVRINPGSPPAVSVSIEFDVAPAEPPAEVGRGDSCPAHAPPEASDAGARGYAHHARGEFEEALSCFRQAACLGDADSMYNLGVMHGHGQGTPRDHAEALSWYRKSAELGNVNAMFNVAARYLAGDGVGRDYTQALAWFRKAAEAGDAAAANNVGEIYRQGLGVSQDWAEALSWYRKAAGLGDPDAMNNIGVIYDHGHGGVQDRAEALSWYRKAAGLGNGPAKARLAQLGVG